MRRLYYEERLPVKEIARRFKIYPKTAYAKISGY